MQTAAMHSGGFQLSPHAARSHQNCEASASVAAHHPLLIPILPTLPDGNHHGDAQVYLLIDGKVHDQRSPVRRGLAGRRTQQIKLRIIKRLMYAHQLMKTCLTCG